MEPNQFDELARKAVQGKEGDASLDSMQADSLWSQIGGQKSKSHVGWWRAAAVILLLLSASLVWYGTGLRHTQQDLEVQLQTALEERLIAQELLKDKESINPTFEKESNHIAQTKTIIARDTVVSYIVEEKIVYVDREVLISPVINTDSLIAIIQNQQKELDQMSSYAQLDESKEYLSNFNVVFEDTDITNEPVQVLQKQASFKFSLSLLKRN